MRNKIIKSLKIIFALSLLLAYTIPSFADSGWEGIDTRRLTDVDGETEPTDGVILKYDADIVQYTPSTIDTTDITDFDISSPANLQILQYNSTSGYWENVACYLFKTFTIAGQSDVVADAFTDNLTIVGSGITAITTNATNDTITITSTEVDGSTTNEINTITTPDLEVTAGLEITFADTGIMTITESADTITFDATEVDGSTTNEINTITTPDAEVTAGLGITFAESGSIAITEAADTITFTVTETDALITAGDALTRTVNDIDFDGGATPGGSLGGTWASPTIDDLFILNSAADTMTGNLTITSTDPAIILDESQATDTDFWLANISDSAGDDDDTFQIGDGTTVGTNPFLTIDTLGNVGIGTTGPTLKLDVAASGGIGFAGTAILSDSAGTMTLSNVDGIDATTETALEGAIDIAGEVTGTGLGSVAIADSVAVTSWNLTTPTITTSLTTDSKTITEAEIGRLDGLAGIIATNTNACTDLEGTGLSITAGVLNSHAAITNYVTNDASDTMTGELTLDPGVLFMKEQAEASADVVAFGQVWVDTATPNTLWFTNDAGTDVQLGVGGATAYDDIGDPDANSSINMAGYTGTYTSASDGFPQMIISGTVADTTVANYKLTIDVTDDGDVDQDFFRIRDNNATDVKFAINQDGDTTIAGTLGVTGAITGSNLSNTNTGDNTVATSGDSATAFFASGEIADAQISDTLTASTCTGNSATVTGLTLNGEVLTLNTGALTLTPAAADSSVLTIGAGAVSVSGSNTGDNTLAATVTIADNESTNENNAIVFLPGGDLDGGNLALECDGSPFTYNPSTGKVTATGFIGALTGQADTVATIAGLAPDTQNTYARTQYLIPYASTTTAFGEIAIGTAAQVLTSNGAGAAPTFQAAAGGVADLNEAYDGGSTITVDAADVFLDGSIAGDKILTVDQAAAGGAMLVVNGGTGVGVDIDQTANGTALEVDNDGTGYGLYLHQDGVIGSAKRGMYVYSNAAQTVDSLVEFSNASASTDQATLWLTQAGSGPALRVQSGFMMMIPLTASQYVKTDGSKHLVSAASFSAGHNYPKKNNSINPGDAVILVDGKIEISKIAKDPRCVGIYFYDTKTRNSITNKLEDLGYVLSMGDSVEWENSLIQQTTKKKYKVKKSNGETTENLSGYSLDKYGQPLIDKGETWTSEDILDVNGKPIVLSEEWNTTKRADGFKVCDEGGPITVGTLLCTSSIEGYLMAQSDDLRHSYTVAKSMEEVIFINGKKENVYGYLSVH